ncbi:MAG: hypothetical protein LBF39_03835 [Prevotellaceae bacterium]|jgi:hypothetical protein|nr:hypothetical protein [Prevotellaceae bacterium]
MKSKHLLLLLLLYPTLATAQVSTGIGVSLTGFTVTGSTVTFTVSWSKNEQLAQWSDSVWVWADYIDSGEMKRLPLNIDAAWASSGTVIKIPGNNKGMYIVGNARTSDATFTTTVSLPFTGEMSGICAYATNYLPLAEWNIGKTELTFTGTPNYSVVLQKGAAYDTVTTGAKFTIPPGYTFYAFTDATGAPGELKCKPAEIQTLQASASSFCDGGAGVELSLAATELGTPYELYKNGEATAIASFVGTGAAAAFNGFFEEGVYTAKVPAADNYCGEDMNNAVTVAKNELPGITTHPQSVEYCSGLTTNLSVAPSSGYTYTWRAGNTVLNVDAGLATYTTPSTLTPGSASYTVTLTDANGCSKTSNTAVVTVYALPVITGQPVSYLLVDLNNPFSLSVTAQPGSGTTLGYQWKRNGSNVTNGNAATYSAAGTVNAGGAYHVVVSNAYACTVTSGNATIDVQDLPPTAECRGFEAGKIGSSATGSCTGFDAGAVGISLACYQFDSGSIGK